VIDAGISRDNFCNEAITIMRRRLLLWLEGPRSPALEAELPRDRAGLKLLHQVGIERRVEAVPQMSGVTSH
jgi:hypothetical protein